MHVVEAHPITVFPRIASTTAQIIPMKLMNATKTPMPIIILMGFIERLVIPSNARASILLSG